MNNSNPFCEITPELLHLSEQCQKSAVIDSDLYTKYDVKRGLRDINGKGVLVGLTNISEVCSTKTENGKSVPADGELYYRGDTVERDLKQAVYWFREAFMQKNPAAIYNLGVCYSGGEGVRQNKSIGLALFRQAENLGYK